MINRNNNKNRKTGLIAIIVIILIAIGGLFYFFNHGTETKETVPLETPSPPAEETQEPHA